MKITLSELKQFIKNVIKENFQEETNSISTPLQAAKSKLEEIGFKEVSIAKTNEPTFKLVKADKTVILSDKSKSISSGAQLTIQVDGKTIAFNSINDSNFKLLLSTLETDINP